MIDPNEKITALGGVGKSTAEKLKKVGVETVRDMLYHFPYRTEDRSEIKPIASLVHGESAFIRATVFSSAQIRRIRKNFTVYSVTLRDESGFLNAVFYNNKYVVKNLKQGEIYSFYGVVKRAFGKTEMINPVYEAGGKNLAVGRIVPVYASTAGLSQKTMQSVAKKSVEASLSMLEETLPETILSRYGLSDVQTAVRNLHFPDNIEDYNSAQRRMVFEEFFYLNLGMRLLSGRRKSLSGTAYREADFAPFEESLPFRFTGAQRRVAGEIASDLKKSVPMNRLVQGDVGSGKTAVAAAALYMTVKNSHQGAMMAPTELLARQHYESLKNMLPGVKIALLTGSTKAKERREIIESLKGGTTDVLVGTHALFSDDVAFSDLTLVITDEQHRFGVKQRASLAGKAEKAPHILVMTATPIPRTLALILYSDLDISVIDELPPGRQKIKTYVVGEDMRRRIYNFIEKNIKEGSQVYIVCPMVTEGDAAELKSVTEYAERLDKEIFPDIAVGFVHGKMKSKEKEEIMERFVAGEIKILVSTTVIEVGVNVPNATLMVVENAERFGLAQLHQLRGRVGRGKKQSYCVLFSDSESKTTRERLDILASTEDGFLIASKDLELRGPGEIFGTRQHGLPEMKIGDIARDGAVLSEASAAAGEVLSGNGNLSHNENALLKKNVIAMFSGKGAEGMFN